MCLGRGTEIEKKHTDTRVIFKLINIKKTKPVRGFKSPQSLVSFILACGRDHVEPDWGC